MENKNFDREIFERSYELVTMYMGFRDKKSIKPAREILEQEIFGDNEQNYMVIRYIPH